MPTILAPGCWARDSLGVRICRVPLESCRIPRRRRRPTSARRWRRRSRRGRPPMGASTSPTATSGPSAAAFFAGSGGWLAFFLGMKGDILVIGGRKGLAHLKHILEKLSNPSSQSLESKGDFENPHIATAFTRSIQIPSQQVGSGNGLWVPKPRQVKGPTHPECKRFVWFSLPCSCAGLVTPYPRFSKLLLTPKLASECLGGGFEGEVLAGKFFGADGVSGLPPSFPFPPRAPRFGYGATAN